MKNKFHQHKNPISMNDVNIDRIVISNKVSFGKEGFKYFIGYEDDYEEVMPLHNRKYPCAYRKDFDETNFMSFLIKDSARKK